MEAINQMVDKVAGVVANELYSDVKRRSPVRSGLFKRSWRKSGRGKQYRITNPQPYGSKLEQGKSKQAPQGVMAPAVRNINQTLRRYGR